MPIIERYNTARDRARQALEEADTTTGATLAQWLDAWPYAPTRQTVESVIVPDTVSDIRPIAWRLTDLSRVECPGRFDLSVATLTDRALRLLTSRT